MSTISKKSKCQSEDSSYQLPLDQEKPRKYQNIEFEKRVKLIEMVVQQKYSIRKASEYLGIKLSTGKFIVNSYRQKGKVMRKKTQIPQEKVEQQIKQPQQAPINLSYQQINSLMLPYQFVYYPYLYNRFF